GSLSTPTIQRALLLVPFPEYSSANRQGYFGSSRYHALALRAEKRFGAGGLVGGNYTFSKNMTNAETLTTWLESGAGQPGGGDTSQRSQGRVATRQLRRPPPLGFELCNGSSVRPRKEIGRGEGRVRRHVDQRVDAERRHDNTERFPGGIHRHSESD